MPTSKVFWAVYLAGIIFLGGVLLAKWHNSDYENWVYPFSIILTQLVVIVQLLSIRAKMKSKLALEEVRKIAREKREEILDEARLEAEQAEQEALETAKLVVRQEADRTGTKLLDDPGEE